MRIAYIINSVEGGGAALPVPAIAQTLRKCGAEIAIFALTRRDGRALLAMTAAGLDVTVRNGGEKDHRAALAWLDRSVGAFEPDILWTSLTRATLLGQLVGARRRIPVVSWQHAAFLKPANRLLLRAMRRLSALWVADSESVAAFSARALGIASERLVTWPIFAVDPAAPRARPWQPGEALRIASLGRLHPVKGYDVLIEALARIKVNDPGHSMPFKVNIGGVGAEQARLQAQIDAAGLSNVTLAGYIGDPRIFLAGQHLYIQPSRSEGFCVAAHEAIQAGLAVIGSAVGEMAHSIEDGRTGLLVPPGDPAALAAALERCLANPGMLQAMGERGGDRLIERFSAARFEQTAASIIQRLAGLCRPARPPGQPVNDRSA